MSEMVEQLQRIRREVLALDKAVTAYNDTEVLKRRGMPLFWEWERQLDRICIDLGLVCADSPEKEPKKDSDA